jgi:hypothetical protein
LREWKQHYRDRHDESLDDNIARDIDNLRNSRHQHYSYGNGGSISRDRFGHFLQWFDIARQRIAELRHRHIDDQLQQCADGNDNG